MNKKDEMLKQLANDFKQLTTKAENKQLSKILQALEACRNEYKKNLQEIFRIEKRNLKRKMNKLLSLERKYFTATNANTTKKR